MGDARGKIILLKRFDLPDLSLSDQLSVPGLNFSPTLWPENNKGFELVYNQLPLPPSPTEKKNETAYIEDYFEPNDLPNHEFMNSTVQENVNAKWDAVEQHLKQAAAVFQETEGQDEGLWITFTSGEHVLNEPNITPEVMALGPEEQRRIAGRGRSEDGAGGGISRVKGGVNERLLRLLKGGLKGKRLGVVVMDFWEMEGEGDLIGAMLGL